jgi:hypothetical protein
MLALAYRSEASRPYAVICGGLAGAFAARVLGQAMQSILPQPFLPPAASFHGSALPYPVLLASQLVILWLMVAATHRLHHGFVEPTRRAGLLLASFGGAYMAVAGVRILIGLAVAAAPAWFSAWIPAAFHVVLAAFVLTLAAYHLVQGNGTRTS